MIRAVPPATERRAIPGTRRPARRCVRVRARAAWDPISGSDRVVRLPAAPRDNDNAPAEGRSGDHRGFPPAQAAGPQCGMATAQRRGPRMPVRGMLPSTETTSIGAGVTRT